MKLKEAYLLAKNLLTVKKINVALEARLLLQHICNLTSVDFITSQDITLTLLQIKKLEELIVKRNTGYPLAYLLNYKYFWKSKFYVNKDVLIPRPETEILIEAGLNLFPNLSSQLKILDIGVGSGVILISLLKEYKQAIGIGVDISLPALKVAALNAKNLLPPEDNRIYLSNQDLYNGLNPLYKFDVIVSNPPYIDYMDKHIENAVKQYEPSIALFAHNNGLFFYEEILKQAKNYLSPKGYILLEIGFNQKAAIKEIGKKYSLNLVTSVKDYNHIERVLIFQ